MPEVLQVPSVSVTVSIEAAIDLVLRTSPQTLTPYLKSQYTAARNWLKLYRPPPKATNLERVKGYLEAFYHLCQLECWQLAYNLLEIQLDTATADTLHNQLGTWGYNSERLALYQPLLGNLPLSQEALLLDGLSHSYHSLGDYATVLDYCQKYGEVVEALGDPVRQIRYWGLLGITNHAMGHYLEAARYHQQRLTLSRDLGNHSEEMNALGDLGIAQHSLGNDQDARMCHEKQLLLSRQIGDRVQEGQALGSLGHVFDLLGQPSKALSYYEQHLALAKDLGDRLGECGALMGIGNLYKSQNAWEQAMACYQQSLDLAEAIKHRRSQGVALGNLASVYNALGHYPKAFELGLECLQIAQSTQNQGAEAHALHTLGLILKQAQDYQEALKYLAGALAKYEAVSDANGQGAVLFNIGIVCLALHEMEQVWYCWLYSLAIFLQMGVDYRVRSILESLSVQICRVLGADFFDQDGWQAVLKNLFAEPLAELCETYGEDVEALVLEALMTL